MKDFIVKQKILCIAVALIVLGGVFGQMFNTSFYSVRVSNISFDTEFGTLTGLLYMPRGAGPNNPRPVIITTHGYLNSAEMQDLNAVEMSRRGFIVLALSMYDHGNSRWAGDLALGSQFDTFWIQGQFSAVQYMFAQPFTARDAQGNGLIGISGHSMGGFSSLIAIYFDEMQARESGVRMIHSALPVGADLAAGTHLGRILGNDPANLIPGAHHWRVLPFEEMNTVEDLLALFGSRPIGFIAGLYDEFFFNNPARVAEIGGPSMRSNWADTPAGQTFLASSIYGPRVIYTPAETHPWNHFSSASVNYMIDFFTMAFAGTGFPDPNVTGQIWQGKVFFNFLMLIGFFMLIVPVMSLLLKLPFFQLAISDESDPVPIGDNQASHIVYWAFIVIGALIPAYLIPYLMQGPGPMRPSSPIIPEFLQTQRVTLGPYFVAPTVSVIVSWALVSAGIAFIITLCFYLFSRRKLGATAYSYGLALNPVGIIASLATAIAGIAIVYALFLIVHAIFLVDARIWVIAIRGFTFEHVLVSLRFIPLFFIFYFMNTIALNANARGRNKVVGYLIALFLNIGGPVIWLAIQFGMLFSRGVAWYPMVSLNAVLVIGLVPILAIAAIYALRLYKETNNVYLAAFVNSILLTHIAISNTASFFNLT